MKPIACRRIVTLLLAGTLLVASTPSEAERVESGIEFVHGLDAALQRAETEGKPVAAFFHAVWCPVCTRMRRETLRAPELAGISDRYIWVSIDIDRELSTAREYDVRATPTIFLLDSEGSRSERLEGLQTAVELRDDLERFLERREAPAGERLDAPTREDASKLTYTPHGYRSSAICFSHVGYGPLALYAQSPFQSLRMAMRPRTPSTLGQGQWQLRGTATWVNVWIVDDFELPEEEQEFFLDTEMLQTALSVAYGITDTLEIEGELQDRSRFGGAMDSFIEGFHDQFRLDQNGRDRHPRDSFDAQFRPQGQPAVVLDDSDRGSYSRSAQATIQHNVTCGTARLPALSYSFTARYNTLDVDLSGGSPWDFGASVAASRRFGKFYLYTTLGYGLFGRDSFRGIELDTTQFSWMLALEWRVAGRLSLLAQYLWTEGVVPGFGPFSDPSNEITLGLKWELHERGTLEFGLIENVIEFDNSPDFGAHVGFTQRF
jgi:thiol-disulfide isomerase/thioredoxin